MKKEGYRDIKGLGESSAELLEAVGYPGPRDLAAAEVAELVLELKKANNTLKILKRSPSVSQLENWIEAARELVGEQAPEPEVEETQQGLVHRAEDDREVDFEADPVVIEMLENAPLAIPVPGSMITGQDIRVGEVVSGVLLNRVRGDLEIRVDTRQSKHKQDPMEKRGDQEPDAEEPQAGDQPRVQRGIDISRLRSTEDFRRGDAPPAPAAPAEDPIETIRTPSAELNVGRDPKSRWFIRGVLHLNAGQVTAGAWATILVFLTVPVAIAASALLLLSDAWPEHFSWVPGWLLVLPLLVPVFGLFYLFFAVGTRCRVCGQRLFLLQRCHKHKKAHHRRGLGYVLPMSIHMLLFKWFRCTHCGTAVRLKK